jgi:CubicO group peptidase (beta-lactamase class C family)
MRLRSGTAQEAGMDPERVARLRKRAEGWASGLSALELVATRRGVTFLHETWGRLRPEKDSPALTKDALWNLMSVSKPFTATAVMLLAEDGLLDLNRPVAFYLPEFRGDGKLYVCVHHLLTHTSGVEDDAIDFRRVLLKFLPEPKLDPTAHPALARYVSLICAVPLAGAPGTRHVYATANFTLLTEIVRRVSGQNPSDFLRSRLFQPLGMHRTHFGLPKELLSQRVLWPPETISSALPQGPDTALSISLHDPESAGIAAGGTGIFSTGADLAVFGQMFLNGGTYGDVRVLARNTVALMTRNHTPGLQGSIIGHSLGEMSVGYGWFINHPMKFPFLVASLGSPGSFSHGGWGGSYLWVDPVEQMVLVFLSTQHTVWPPASFPAWEADLFVNAVTSAIGD